MVDEDQDRLLCHRPDFRSVGGNEGIIYDKNEEEVIKKKSGSGTRLHVVLCGASGGLEQVLERPRADAHYRWIVDCQGICASLARFEKQDNALVHILRRLITSLTKDTGPFLDVIWMSSHFGLQ